MKTYHIKECPLCGGNTNVINTRSVRDDGVVKRLRKCFGCDYAFETAEVPAENVMALEVLEEANNQLEKENLKLRAKLLRIEKFVTKEFLAKEA